MIHPLKLYATNSLFRALRSLSLAVATIGASCCGFWCNEIAYAVERPKDVNALTADEIQSQLDDPLVGAYLGLITDKLAVDQEALARLANVRRRHAPPAVLAEYTLVLLDALLDTEETPVEVQPPGGWKERPFKESDQFLVVDPGPPTQHDLNFLSGRAAFMLERLYDIKLPPSTKESSLEQRQDLQREALRQILLAKMKNELDVIPKLDEAERVRLARDRWTHPAVLEILAEDPSTKVLFALVDGRGIPASAHKKLLSRIETEQDPDLQKRLHKAAFRTSGMLSPIDAPARKRKRMRVQELIEQAWDAIEAKERSKK